MPYVPLDTCRSPETGARIWRYMDLSRLVCLLHSESLFFCRIDRLRDRYEGAASRWSMNVDARVMSLDGSMTYDEARMKLAKHHWARMQRTFVHCWHVNQFESAAMWNLYSRGGDGLAICSTVGALQESFACAKDLPVHLGLVNYIDYATTLFDVVNPTGPALHKRLSFEHEHELRALVHLEPVGSVEQEPKPGLDVPIDVRTLVQTVFVSPTSDVVFGCAVKTVLEHFGHGTVPCVQSNIDSDPIY